MVESHFLIPMRRDAEISDGQPHETEAWDWLNHQMQVGFDGWTRAPGYYHGVWKNPKSGQIIHDESRQYILAIPEIDGDKLRGLLKLACRVFAQRCLYLAIAGRVEFVEPDNYGQEF